MPVPVIAVFDIGKTNKKLLLLNEQYHIVFEQQTSMQETTDDTGDPCEDLPLLVNNMRQQLAAVLAMKEFEIKAVNISAYGASLVYIDENGAPAGPLYNYLKPYPEALLTRFYNSFGGREQFSHQTASPALGSLNAGLQLYRVKHQQPSLYSRTRYVLHLPQFLSYLFSCAPFSEMTSIGCHTGLWDFTRQQYHPWVSLEGWLDKLPPITPTDHTTPVQLNDKAIRVGIGIHDSSAALLPYLLQFREPFVLLSTGTWCISMNPFNHEPLTSEELQQDCLCYLRYDGRPVKSSRLFAGHAHDTAVQQIAAFFREDPRHFKELPYDPQVTGQLVSSPEFSILEMSRYENSSAAYHHLVMMLVKQQYHATRLVLGQTTIGRLFVDGGFARNNIYMHLLARVFPDMEVYAATVSQASATGAALVIHNSWNAGPVPGHLVQLKRYAATF
ncbi:Sugar (pentulose or hexulose) kinase [Chitinophaga eiseniae]|uniref:Sugar (Pentulose or hexulose) kinase n=1 Tax=Chitinophaga eiseniae TaxID=634771 RepID=A0A1T4L5D3_9BACT|nr:FGGY family carbohydrate kinase [Chitinophaga eiseniae]SJZ49767.1 Sugar (pentulose or hexulose) kinase [Chitinophaga eiseniae]